MPDKNTRFLIDTNLFVAASKSGWTKSTDLLITLLEGPWDLVADNMLISEYERYAEKFDASDLLALLKLKIIVIEQSEEDVAACKPFLSEGAAADTVHAATCLHTGAILISNDAHFDRIRDSGIIEVWKISEAIERIL